jgi:hypothetical protein
MRVSQTREIRLTYTLHLTDQTTRKDSGGLWYEHTVYITPRRSN